MRLILAHITNAFPFFIARGANIREVRMPSSRYRMRGLTIVYESLFPPIFGNLYIIEWVALAFGRFPCVIPLLALHESILLCFLSAVTRVRSLLIPRLLRIQRVKKNTYIGYVGS